MSKSRILAIVLLILGAGLGFFIYSGEGNPDAKFPFRYGLDLDGGTHLTYRADTSQVAPTDVNASMDALRRTIERRVNIFGVSEPIVQVEKGGVFSEDVDANRLIVELPGVTNVQEAIDAIGKTPVLEFRLLKDNANAEILNIDPNAPQEEIINSVYNIYEATGLGGAQLKRAQVVFDHVSGEPTVSVDFNGEGSDLFASLTKENVGVEMGIFLDKVLISSPVIRQEIIGGTAQISGGFTAEEARDLAQDLSLGALPLPIEIIETQSVGASLGQETLNKSVSAFSVTMIAIIIFLIIWYRLPGLLAGISLIIYVLITFSIFKLIPVTLTSSGLAGFILSLGMAVDANILIFERIKEELRRGEQPFQDAIGEGFKRAWLPIRDGNLSSIISALVLYWLSGTSVVQGFALVFGIGILVSMFTAVVVSRTLLFAISKEKPGRILQILFSSGFSGNFPKGERDPRKSKDDSNRNKNENN